MKNKNTTFRGPFPSDKNSESVSQLKSDLTKSRKSGDKLAEIVYLYLKSRKSLKELDKALLKYEKSEGWMPDDFKNLRFEN